MQVMMYMSHHVHIMLHVYVTSPYSIYMRQTWYIVRIDIVFASVTHYFPLLLTHSFHYIICNTLLNVFWFFPAECPPLRFPSLDMRCVYGNEETSCERDVKPGTIATPKCKQNYKLSINYQTKITCLQGGEWDSKPIPCTPGKRENHIGSKPGRHAAKRYSFVILSTEFNNVDYLIH